MRSRLCISVAVGALTALAAVSIFHTEAGADEDRPMAYRGEGEVQLAQQAEPAPPGGGAAGANDAAGASDAAGAAGAAPEENTGPGWAVNCKSAAKDPDLECRLSQTVVTQRGAFLAEVTISVPAGKTDVQAIVRMPLGVFLPTGALLKIDDKVPLQLNFRACDRNGCYARGPVSAEMLSDLQGGMQLNLSFKNLAEKEIDVPLSLDGFAEAYAKI